MAFMSNESQSRPWSWAPSGGGSDLPAFATQSDAETWLGEHFEDLLADGITAVTLMESGNEVYGPMSLNPDQPLGTG